MTDGGAAVVAFLVTLIVGGALSALVFRRQPAAFRNSLRAGLLTATIIAAYVYLVR
jgi:hypothetical protein